MASADYDNSNEADNFRKAWEKLICNIHSLDSWLEFIEIAENETLIENRRYAYSEFLKRYPYYIKYWKKYAELELAEGNGIEQAKSVCEEAVNAIKTCVELWIFYVNLCKEATSSCSNSEISKLYRRAVDACGLNFYSDKLWLSYLDWEKSFGSESQYMNSFEQYLSIPTENTLTKYSLFVDSIKNLKIISLCTPDEYIVHSRKIEDKIKNMDSKRRKNIQESEKERLIKESIIEIISAKAEELNSQVVSSYKKRLVYEEKIKEGLSKNPSSGDPQLLTNWMEYLNFEMELGDPGQVEVLFERSLMVFPHCEELWIKYVDYMERTNLEKTRAIYCRSCWTYLLSSYTLNMNWAIFEESNGYPEEAENVLYHFDQNCYGQPFIRMRLVNLCRRNNRLDKAIQFLQSYVETAESTEEKLFYIIKHTDFLVLVLNDKVSARKVLSDSLQSVQQSHEVLLSHWLDLEKVYPISGEEIYLLLKFAHSDTKINEEFKLKLTIKVIDLLEQFGTLQNLVNSYALLHQAFPKHNVYQIDNDEFPTKAPKRSAFASESIDKDISPIKRIHVI